VIDDASTLIYENKRGKWTYNHELDSVSFEPYST